MAEPVSQSAVAVFNFIFLLFLWRIFLRFFLFYILAQILHLLCHSVLLVLFDAVDVTMAMAGGGAVAHYETIELPERFNLISERKIGDAAAFW